MTFLNASQAEAGQLHVATSYKEGATDAGNEGARTKRRPLQCLPETHLSLDYPHNERDRILSYIPKALHTQNISDEISLRIEGGDVAKRRFELHREEIKALYLDRNLSLKQVMEHMRRKGFRAT
jgi:hypothetical protein